MHSHTEVRDGSKNVQAVPDEKYLCPHRPFNCCMFFLIRGVKMDQMVRALACDAETSRETVKRNKMAHIYQSRKTGREIEGQKEGDQIVKRAKLLKTKKNNN